MMLFKGQEVVDTRPAGDPQRIGLLLESPTGARQWMDVWRSEYRDGRCRLKTNLPSSEEVLDEVPSIRG